MLKIAVIAITILGYTHASPPLKGQLDPRQLTISEVKEDTIVPLHSIVDNTIVDIDETKTDAEVEPPFGWNPPGANEEKTVPKDLVRMPGTKWCGPGWRTDKAMKFGGYAASDRCCRHHDLVCPLSINPGETMYGLLNDKFHTVMHCSCDDRFRSCLKMVNNQAADIVGNLFFNIGKTPCFVFRVDEVCHSRNWWGQCLQKSEQPVAIWRKAVPY